MRLKFFWIPYLEFADAEAELNQFLAQHRVVHVERRFCALPPGWSLCVEWLTGAKEGAVPVLPSGSEKAGKLDYRQVLDEPTFQIFAALRVWRKERANADGVPLYTVATNEPDECGGIVLRTRGRSPQLRLPERAGKSGRDQNCGALHQG